MIGVRRTGPRRRRALLALAVAWTLLGSGAVAQDAAPRARARLSAPGPVIVGEPVRVVVDVLVPNFFMGAPGWPDVLEMADAIASLDALARANFTERIDGSTYAGQTREYVVYAQAPGTISIPSFEVPVRFALDSGQPSDLTLTTPELEFEARIPEEAASLGYFFATSSFQVDERFDGPLTDLKVGDAIVRTITMTATNSSAMLLPPVPFDPIDGVALYPGQPRVIDRGGERGSPRVSERVDSVTYVLQREGELFLPEVAVSWWDSTLGRLRTASLPERRLEVGANPRAAPEIALPEEAAADDAPPAPRSRLIDALHRQWPSFALVLGAVLVSGWILRRYRRRAWTAVVQWRRRQAEGERACFRRLRRASLRDDPAATYAAARAWLACVSGGDNSLTLESLAEATGNTGLAREHRTLMAHLYGRDKSGTGAWSGRVLSDVLDDARRAGQQRVARPGGALPDLNPRQDRPVSSERRRPARALPSGVSAALLAALMTLAATSAAAQEMEPKAYSASPVGANFLVASVARSTGSVVFDPTLPFRDVEARIGVVVVGVGTTFGLFGKLALVSGALPYSWGKVLGKVGEAPQTQSVTRSGLADSRVKLSVNLRGNPALRAAEFAKLPRRTILGASVTLAAPSGQYDGTKLINLGTNRWAVKPEVGVAIPRGRWDIDGYAGVWLFSRNTDFFPGGLGRTQDPVVAIQGHVSYTFRPRLWVALDGTWYSGGEVQVEDGAPGGGVNNSRLGATLSVPVGRRQSFKASYSSGISVRTGTDFRTVAVAWQWLWLRR